MGTRPCNMCGGKASRFAKHAMCGSCLDEVIELAVLRKKDIEFDRACKALLDALKQEE